jgi:acetyl esterase
MEPVNVRADVLLPLPGRAIRVRAYRHVTPTPAPLLLWLHGGGFVGGAVEDIETACAGLARRSRTTVLSLDYRLAPEHPYPAALDDTYDALHWLRENGELLGGDGRVYAGGQSAGANLVAAACLKARDGGTSPADRQVLCYPWLDLSAAETGSDLARARDDYLAGQPSTPYAEPLTATDLDHLPPALVLGAGADELLPDAREYAKRLGATYVEYAGAAHAFLNFPDTQPVAWKAIQDIADFLRS